MDVKKFKTMSEVKRFSRTGYEANKNRNRTIEHMYQDHTPAELWRHAPIIDPANPYEKDEKKNYKLFTYHPEPRYNTLLPDIPFERLNLIKEYVHSNQVDVSDTMNGNVSNKVYLDEYIALENQMLASRYGEVSQQLNPTEESPVKLENLQKRLLERSEDNAKRVKLSEDDEERDESGEVHNGDVEMEDMTALRTQVPVDSALGDTLKNLTLEDQLDGSQIKAPILSSTQADMDDSNGKDLLQIDSGIVVDISEITHPGKLLYIFIFI